MKGYIDEFGYDRPPCAKCKHKDKMTVESPCYSCIDNVDLALHKPNCETEFANYEEAKTMDVREKLVELLKKTEINKINGHTALAEVCFTPNVFENMATNLISHGVTVQEWISTDERMPTEDDATDGYVAVVYAWGDGVKTKTISLVDVVIAHPDLYDYWMPLNLPQPPKGE